MSCSTLYSFLYILIDKEKNCYFVKTISKLLILKIFRRFQKHQQTSKWKKYDVHMLLYGGKFINKRILGLADNPKDACSKSYRTGLVTVCSF